MNIASLSTCGGCFDSPCTCGMYAYAEPTAGQRSVEAEAVGRSSDSPSREELVEFVRCICEGDVPIGSGGKIHGVRAIELAAWNFYRRLQEAHEL